MKTLKIDLIYLTKSYETHQYLEPKLFLFIQNYDV